MSDTACEWCDGACVGADIHPLLVPELAWLWDAVAAKAERQGDPTLDSGRLTVSVPPGAKERHAAGGLLGERPLVAGTRRLVSLTDLTVRLRVRGPLLTPGAVAAHASERRLAVRARARRDRAALEERLRARLAAGLGTERVDELWGALVRSGWVGRLRAAPDPGGSVDAVVRVIQALPAEGARVDRRSLGDGALDDPHGLDDGRLVPGLVLGIMAAAGRTPIGLRSRDAWAALGVDSDDVLGGLIAVGVFPRGWVVPPGGVATIPPRELRCCHWPSPDAERAVFVTENPSVLAAAASLVDQGAVARVLCTSGTPSSVMIDAIHRLSDAGWMVAVRADFDAPGLAHVRELLAGIPEAVPWRMSANDYLESIARSPDAPRLVVGRLGDTPWDPSLASVMSEHGIAAYEETLMPTLLDSIATAASWEATRPAEDVS